MKDEEINHFIEKLIASAPADPVQQPREYRSFPIVQKWHESERYIGLRLGVDRSFWEAYETPGQYVTLQLGQCEPRFFVLANAPGRDIHEGWEFLIEPDDALTTALAELSTGKHVGVSLPEGSGYPIVGMDAQHLLLFATGSGIASIRPVIQLWSTQPENTPKNLTLYYGESRAEDFAYHTEFDVWRAQGARVFLATGSHESNENAFRYVQDAFAFDKPSLKNAAVLLSGAPIMFRHVVEDLLRLDMPMEKIFINI